VDPHSNVRHLTHELDELTERLFRAAGLVETRLRRAIGGLVERDLQGLAGVVAADTGASAMHASIDERCFTLLALQQPVAVDLRTIVSILKINADLERVGGLAVNVAETAGQYLLYRAVRPLVDLRRMGDLALKMLREAIDAFVSRDITLAHAVLQQDEWLDALRDQVFRVLLTHMLGDPDTIEPGIDLILVSRHLERVGDHATNIAEDVIFVVEGRDVRRGSASRAVERRRTVHGTSI